MEFDVIARYFQPLSLACCQDDVAIGDDGALITPPADAQLVVVTDTLVSGVHFLAQTSAYDIAWKALAVNLSDLAAMGARPAFYSLALTLPQVDSAWLNAFSKGLADCAAPYGVSLIGGDTTKGPLCVTITAQGWVKRGAALRRSGAQIEDDVYVSGVMGEGGLGLSLALACQRPLNAEQHQALNRLHRPQPRVELGLALVGLAHAAIDISDGLLADLNHMLEASGVGAALDYAAIPLTQAVQLWAQDQRLKPLQAGDDYELCFSAPESAREKLKRLAGLLNLPLSRIGKITRQSGLVIDGETQSPSGYVHF
jgi:thiamine-monophosphate kinase